jgi:energy-coupling factor transporter ATP-binding protein EcfA2
VYVTDVQVRDLRCIAGTRLTLLHPERDGAESLEIPNVNLLVGPNGGGKSTVLKAVVLGLLGPQLEESRFDPEGWVRRGSRGTSEVGIGVFDPPEGFPPRMSVRIEEGRSRTTLRASGPPVDSEASTFIAAYGSVRRAVPTRDSTPTGWHGEPMLQRVASLLDDDATLVPLEKWLREMPRRSKRFQEIVALLDRLLPATTRFAARTEKDSYLFEHNDLAVPLQHLSEGLRSHIAWIGDLLYHLNDATPRGQRLTDTPGVVLIDEIDHRMHPRWQLQVLPTLAGHLPRLQWIASAHSPLLAGSLRAANLALLEPDRDVRSAGAMRTRRLVEDVFGRTADRVLTSSYFDLESSRADAFRAELRKLVELARGGDPDAPLRFMHALASGDPAAKVPPREPVRERGRRTRKGKGRRP